MASRRRVAHQDDDLSLETTVPTDLSFSPDEVSDLQTTDDDGGHAGAKVGGGARVLGGGTTASSAARHLLEKKHLQHDVQALKIELSQKSFLLDNVKVIFKIYPFFVIFRGNFINVIKINCKSLSIYYPRVLDYYNAV